MRDAGGVMRDPPSRGFGAARAGRGGFGLWVDRENTGKRQRTARTPRRFAKALHLGYSIIEFVGGCLRRTG
jgi:hypothetical protein